MLGRVAGASDRETNGGGNRKAASEVEANQNGLTAAPVHRIVRPPRGVIGSDVPLSTLDRRIVPRPAANVEFCS